MSIHLRWALVCLVVCIAVGQRAVGQAPAFPRIFAANKDGTKVELLVDLPNMQWHGQADWSPDGKLIVVDATPQFRNFVLSRICVHAIGGPFKGTTKDLGCGNVPRWSPDGNQIAFHVRAGSPDGALPGIWVMNDDGTERKWISDGLNPRWLPDGRSLLFISQGADGSAIDSVKLDGSGRKRLVKQAFPSIAAAGPSADGKAVAFIAYPKQAYDGELCTAPLAENAEHKVLYRGKIGWRPTFSPDGRQILFWIMDDAQNRHLCVLDVDGQTAPVKLANQEGTKYNSDAEWSRDGKRIAFSSDRVAPPK
jgi:dipeptidyl aminopeptidase/acylaminoacyl peptidase